MRMTYQTAANRLKSATSWERTSGAPNINNKYSEPLISYDLNGNITQYQRRGLTTGSTYDLIDNLTYTYGASNIDRLSTVSDAAAAAAKPYGFKPNATAGTYYYGYDSAGNLLTDGHKDLLVAYNVLNLPDVFTFILPNPDNSIEIGYNAAGEKLEKKVYTGATLSTHKRYVMGIEYTGANLEAIYHAEGRIVAIGGGVFQYEYTLKDHLGNSRVMFAANGTAINLLQENHYYPFGMEMKGAWIAQAGTENSYQYNGKELNEDWGLNWSDYGARWYDASVGRFTTEDRYVERYLNISPYQYAANNPLLFIDANGDSIKLAASFLANKLATSALKEILRTKEGYAYFAKFAAKGDKILGFKFIENGEYSKQGVDVKFSVKELPYQEGVTTIDPDNNPKNGFDINVTLKDGKNDQNFAMPIFNLSETIIHEVMMHGDDGGIQDIRDDGKRNYSNISSEAKKLANGSKIHYDHKQESLDNKKNQERGVWPQVGLRILTGVNQNIKVGLSPDQIKGKMLDYSGN